jgi:hypothetical protein
LNAADDAALLLYPRTIEMMNEKNASVSWITQVLVLLIFTKGSWSFVVQKHIGLSGCRYNKMNGIIQIMADRKRQRVPLHIKVDPYRDTNNKRPSLHPITINILSQALKLRATNARSNSTTSYDEKENPLEVVVQVSALAATALAQRQSTSTKDQMTLTVEEQQTVAGRVVGVMVRIRELQNLLYKTCRATPWIAKYNEWHSFGLVQPPDLDPLISPPDSNNFSELLGDPLLLLNRAECLLALFLHSVEIPELRLKNCSVPDQSIIDFLDEDRQAVLLFN